VTFDFGELYAGSIAIDPKNASESLFFVFAPKIGEECEDITIWLNGGPGCSSLMGWLQENGPVSWQPGTYAPVKNPYSWTNLTNMIW
jgi:carboxypeptidase D